MLFAEIDDEHEISFVRRDVAQRDQRRLVYMILLSDYWRVHNFAFVDRNNVFVCLSRVQILRILFRVTNVAFDAIGPSTGFTWSKGNGLLRPQIAVLSK